MHHNYYWIKLKISLWSFIGLWSMNVKYFMVCFKTTYIISAIEKKIVFRHQYSCIFSLMFALKICEVQISITRQPNHVVWAHVIVITRFKYLLLLRLSETFKIASLIWYVLIKIIVKWYLFSLKKKIVSTKFRAIYFKLRKRTKYHVLRLFHLLFIFLGNIVYTFNGIQLTIDKYFIKLTGIY